jgi:hypothetical protein
VPEAAARTFTLKELVRLVEHEPGVVSGGLEATVAAAAERRDAASSATPTSDDDVADPLGMPMATYREMAWELEDLTDRLATAMFGPAPAPARAAGGKG